MRCTAGTGTCDGIELHFAGISIEFQVGFRGCANEFIICAADIEHIGRRVGLAQLAVSSERIWALHGERPRRDNLVNITFIDILLQVAHVLAEVLVQDIRGDGNGFLFGDLGGFGQGGIDKLLCFVQVLI